MPRPEFDYEMFDAYKADVADVDGNSPLEIEEPQPMGDILFYCS